MSVVPEFRAFPQSREAVCKSWHRDNTLQSGSQLVKQAFLQCCILYLILLCICVSSFTESWTLCENTLRLGNGDSYFFQKVFLQVHCFIMYLFLLSICISSFANSCTFDKFGIRQHIIKWVGWKVIAVLWRRLQDFVQNMRIGHERANS